MLNVSPTTEYIDDKGEAENIKSLKINIETAKLSGLIFFKRFATFI